MSNWDGTSWVSDEPAKPQKASARPKRAATLMIVIGLFALLLPLQMAFAGSKSSAPSLTTGCANGCAVGASLTVRGRGFTPSVGGQQVILYIEYPGDYCVSTTCHGFYVQPWVNSDGSFVATYDNALLQSGQGGVSAVQYNARTDKWVNVAYVDYDAN